MAFLRGDYFTPEILQILTFRLSFKERCQICIPEREFGGTC